MSAVAFTGVTFTTPAVNFTSSFLLTTVTINLGLEYLLAALSTCIASATKNKKRDNAKSRRVVPSAAGDAANVISTHVQALPCLAHRRFRRCSTSCHAPRPGSSGPVQRDLCPLHAVLCCSETGEANLPCRRVGCGRGSGVEQTCSALGHKQHTHTRVIGDRVHLPNIWPGPNAALGSAGWAASTGAATDASSQRPGGQSASLLARNYILLIPALCALHASPASWPGFWLGWLGGWLGSLPRSDSVPRSGPPGAPSPVIEAGNASWTTLRLIRLML